MDVIEQRSIPTSREKPKIVVIGAGIAGLTVAHELQRTKKFQVEVIEKRSKAGGKARTEWIGQRFREHSMRILPGSYVCMHQIMAEIETPRGAVIERLRPARIVFEHGDKRTEVLGDYTQRFRLFKYLRDTFRLLGFLNRCGVSSSELIIFIYKVFRLLWTPPRKVRSEISRLGFSNYVSGDRISPGFEHVIVHIAEILVAAKSYASAGVVGRTLLEWFVTPFLKGKLVRRKISEFDAPTSGALIEPWVAWLEHRGVRFGFGQKVTEINTRAGRVVHLEIGKGDATISRRADAYVLAVQHNVADALLPDALIRYIPDLFEFPRLGEEWAHSAQFCIQKLPDRLRKLGTRSVAVIDSPWSIGYKVYSKATWREEDWTAAGLGDDGAIVTATISNSRRPGVVHGLPLLRCTRQQILEEVLAQTRLEDILENRSGDIGLDLDILPIDSIDEDSPAYSGYAISAVGDPDNHVFVSDALMYIRLPGNRDIEPDNATGVYNLFLAGEYTRTDYQIPTMEKSCESGKRCAQAILRGFGIEPDEDRIPHCSLPFAMLRSEAFRIISSIIGWLVIVGSMAWLLIRST